jgi:PadR family transcriptional regulator, regulatory protein PadR
MKTEFYQLGELEELVLMMVAILQEDAYGVKVMDEIADQINRKVNISAVHTVLDRLEKKEFVSSKMGGASAERGGRRKRIFQVTTEGSNAIAFVHRTRNQLYNMIPKTTLASIISSYNLGLHSVEYSS